MSSSIRLARRFANHATAAVLIFVLGSAAFAAKAKWSSYLTISGVPSTSVVAGQGYAFQPTASGASGGTLTFSVSNMPAWASFSRSTGKLSGTPQATNVGSYSNIVIAVTDGRKTARLPAFTISVLASTVQSTTTTVASVSTSINTAPVIGGTPAAQVMAGAIYRFQPTASDADGDVLSFSATNLPAWAAFDAATGVLSGAPTAAQVGSYGNIQISVSDGKGGITSLPAFSIAVIQAATGSATISWMPPTQNTDGSALTDLAGYTIFYGTTHGGPYSGSVGITNPSVSTYLVDNLTPGTYYFVVTARTLAGVESSFSSEASKTIN